MPRLGSLGSGGAKGFGFSGAGGAAPIGNLAISLSLTGLRLYPVAVAGDASGNIYIGAYQDDGIDDVNQFAYVLKLNSAGVVQWQKQMRWTNGSTRFANRTFMFRNCLKVDSSGNVYIAFTQDCYTSGYTAFLTKFNSSGTLLWQQAYQQANGGVMTIQSIVLNAAETAVYAGFTPNSAGGNDNNWVASLSASNGAVNWATNYYSGYGWYQIAVQPNGNIVTAGKIYNVSPARFAIQISQWNSSGTLQWQLKYMNGNNSVTDTGLSVDASNNIYLGYGYTDGSALLSGGGGVLKLNNSGTEVASARAYNNAPSVMALSTTGELYGFCYDTSSTVLVSKWNSSLAGQWQTKLTGVTPAALSVQNGGASLGSANATTFLGVTQPKDGTNYGGVVFRLLRDGTGSGGGNKTASPFTVSYGSATSNILAQYDFTLSNNTGSLATQNFGTDTITTTNANSSITVNTVLL